MKGNANSNQYQHISNANSAPYKHPQPDTQTVSSQQKQGIPPLLAQVVPDEMDIISVGPGPDGRPVYIVTRELAYGTAEDVIKYLMENSLLSDPDIEAYIITPELEHRKSGYVERKRRPYQGNVVRIA